MEGPSKYLDSPRSFERENFFQDLKRIFKISENFREFCSRYILVILNFEKFVLKLKIVVETGKIEIFVYNPSFFVQNLILLSKILVFSSNIQILVDFLAKDRFFSYNRNFSQKSNSFSKIELFDKIS